MKKTKNLELSVGLGLQKVFTFKQEESDGLMVTILDFLNKLGLKMRKGPDISGVRRTYRAFGHMIVWQAD